MGKNVAEWLNQRFLEWQLQSGERQTVRSFARYLDVKETSLSGWMRGANEPTGTNLEKIALKMGSEIYEVMGVKKPDTRLLSIEFDFSRVPEDKRDALVKLVQEFANKYGRLK